MIDLIKILFFYSAKLRFVLKHNFYEWFKHNTHCMHVYLSRMWLLDRKIRRTFVRVNKQWSSFFLWILITPMHYIVFELDHPNGLLAIKQAFPCTNRSVIKWILSSIFSVMVTTPRITVCFNLYIYTSLGLFASLGVPFLWLVRLILWN